MPSDWPREERADRAVDKILDAADEAFAKLPEGTVEGDLEKAREA